MTKHPAKIKKKRKRDTESQVSIYPAWCKRCGNCVEFCPTHAMTRDEWGYPRLEDPEKCTSCHLCEKLCPDFAISIGEKPPRELYAKETGGPPPAASHELDGLHSPERVASYAREESDEGPDGE
jgi:2-oxoglutarate ferredoxin oxidoreductase subunit delta